MKHNNRIIRSVRSEAAKDFHALILLFVAGTSTSLLVLAAFGRLDETPTVFRSAADLQLEMVDSDANTLVPYESENSGKIVRLDFSNTPIVVNDEISTILTPEGIVPNPKEALDFEAKVLDELLDRKILEYQTFVFRGSVFSNEQGSFSTDRAVVTMEPVPTDVIEISSSEHDGITTYIRANPIHEGQGTCTLYVHIRHSKLGRNKIFGAISRSVFSAVSRPEIFLLGYRPPIVVPLPKRS